MRCSAIAILLLPTTAIFACGDGDSLSPPPPLLERGPVSIQSDPLLLTVDAPNDTFSIEAFIEVATVGTVDPSRYYDPRDTDDELEWRAATRAIGYDDATSELVLDNDVRIRLDDGPLLRVDAGEVDQAVLVRLVLPREGDEAIFGFGENFRSAVAGGDVREMQMRVEFDSESALNESHVPVPLSLWPKRGVGVFVEDPRPGAFDIGAAREDAVLATFTLAEPGPFAVHLFTAADPLELVRAYVARTAVPALPPKWAFAPQQWRNEHQSSDEVRDDANAMRQQGIPGSVMWIDNPWQTAYNDFIFDEGRFADPEGMLAEVTDLGYKVLVWSTPYVNDSGLTQPDFREAAEMGYLVTDGRVPLVLPWQDGPGALVDFTAPGAIDWWRERISRITDLGIAGFKLDFGEDIVPELGGVLTPFQTADGNAQIMHNAYAHGYHQAYLGALPPGDGFLITRSGSYGEQAVNTCIWPGDLDNDFSRHGTLDGDGTSNVGGLPAAVAAGLSLSVSGYPFFGSDIGGFRNGLPGTEVLLRWAQYAALGTIMQLGGGGRSHNPWDTELFTAEALPIYRRYARLHMDLIPYIYSLAVIAGSDGTPVVRPTRFIHPDAASDDATYLLGDALFVAPVIEEGATTREVVLPPGMWIDWWTGERHQGDGTTTMTVSAPLDTLPLWRRKNAFVPMFAIAADTLIPANSPSVTSYAEPAYGRELRLLGSPDADPGMPASPTSIELHDGATATGRFVADDYAVTLGAGDEFDVFTLDLDHPFDNPHNGAVTAVFEAVSLPTAADEAGLSQCPAPGCMLWQPGTQRLLVRVFGSGEVVVQKQ